jgi:hemolysin activation/secretion protein
MKTEKRIGWLMLVMGSLLAWPGVSFGQDPGAISGAEDRQRETIRDNYRILKQIDQGRNPFEGMRISSPQKPPVDLDSKSDVKNLRISRIVFDPVPRALTAAELKELTSPFEGKEASLRDLYRLTIAIDALYDRKGIVGRAVLPVQEVKDGIVRIQVVEAVVGDITTASSRPLRSWYVRKTLGMDPGELLNLSRLEERVIRYNRLNDAQASVELAPGKKPGQSDLQLRLVDPPLVSGGVYSDNAGRDTTGELRAGAFVRLNNPLGINDSLFVSQDFTEGSESTIAQLRLPVTPWGTMFHVGFDYNTYKIIDGPFEVLEITGRSRGWELGLSQPVWAGRNGVVNLFGNIGKKESWSWFDGVQQFYEDIQTYSLGLDLLRQDKHGIWYGSQSVGVGEDQANDLDNFMMFRGNLARVQWLDENWTVVARGSWQYTPDDSIPSSQQFQIGGVASVRGFEEGLVSGENGYAVSLELKRALWRREGGKLLEGLVFLDHGGVFVDKHAATVDGHTSLTSAGIGLNAAWGRHVSGRIAFGVPLEKGDYADDISDSGRIHFSVQISF